MITQIMNQYGDFTSAVDAARVFVKVKQEKEIFSDLASWVLRLSKIAYKDTVQCIGEAVQTQLSTTEMH